MEQIKQKIEIIANTGMFVKVRATFPPSAVHFGWLPDPDQLHSGLADRLVHEDASQSWASPNEWGDEHEHGEVDIAWDEYYLWARVWAADNGVAGPGAWLRTDPLKEMK